MELNKLIKEDLISDKRIERDKKNTWLYEKSMKRLADWRMDAKKG